MPRGTLCFPWTADCERTVGYPYIQKLHFHDLGIWGPTRELAHPFAILTARKRIFWWWWGRGGGEVGAVKADLSRARETLSIQRWFVLYGFLFCREETKRKTVIRFIFCINKDISETTSRPLLQLKYQHIAKRTCKSASSVNSILVTMLMLPIRDNAII